MEPRDEIRPLGLGTPRPGSGAQHDASRIGQEAGRMGDEIRDEARGVADQAREQATRLAGKAREQARSAVESRKDQAAGSLESLSGALRDGAGRLRGEQSFFGDYAEGAADRVDRLARYLRDSDPERFVRDAENFARRRPEVFMGGMLIAGLLLARFLKSSAPGFEDNDFVYAGGGGTGSVGGAGGFGGGTTGFSGRETSPGARAGNVDPSWQPESGAYGGSTQRPNSPNVGTTRGTTLTPDDDSGLGV